MLTKLVALFLLASLWPGPSAQAEDAAPAEPVMEISRVFAIKLSDTPPTYQIEAMGSVPTAGWTNPRLVPVDGELGVQNFTFVATPPAGPAAQVVEHIEAWTRWTPQRSDIRRVRVRAGNMAVEVRLPEE